MDINKLIALKNHHCELHSSLRHLMRLARWNGFLPLEGLNDPTPGDIRFNLKSFYSIYYVTSVVFIIITTCLTLFGLFINNISLNTVNNSVFTLVGIVTVAMLFRVAKNWPRVINEAMEVERDLKAIRKAENIPRICNMLAYIIMVLALVEHVLCSLFYLKLVNCSDDFVFNSTTIERFFKYRISYIFNHMPYSLWGGIFFNLINLQSTFMWSFGDVYIMCFSVYITSYFQDLGKALNANGPKNWSQLRQYHSRLVLLVHTFNSQLGGFILLSAFNDLFFICLQLFNSLHQGYLANMHCDYVEPHMNRSVGTSHLFYYLYSFLYVVLRALLMAYLAANVNRSANSAVLVLYEVPTAEYSIEVQRFQFQVRYLKVGMCGLFFYVERKHILSVIGTIITYELVMLQFSFQDEATNSHQNSSNILRWNTM